MKGGMPLYLCLKTTERIESLAVLVLFDVRIGMKISSSMRRDLHQRGLITPLVDLETKEDAATLLDNWKDAIQKGTPWECITEIWVDRYGGFYLEESDAPSKDINIFSLVEFGLGEGVITGLNPVTAQGKLGEGRGITSHLPSQRVLNALDGKSLVDRWLQSQKDGVSPHVEEPAHTPITDNPSTFTPTREVSIRLKNLTLGGEVEVKEGDRVVFGRDKNVVDCVLVDAERTISRKHAEVYERDGFFWVKDLGSSNGTRVNGVSKREPSRLRDGDRLELASVVFQVEVV